MNIGDIIPVVIVLVVAGIVTSFGATILSDFQADQEDDGYAYNATGNALEGLDNLAGQFPNLALVVIAAIIVGVLLAAFGGQMR